MTGIMKVRWRSIFSLIVVFCLSLPGEASPSKEFRTPARRFGTAYSVKVTILRGGFSYVIPMWVRPDQKVSSLDLGQLAFYGWTDPNLRNIDLVVSGESLGTRSFSAGRADFAVKPDHAKNCCVGVLGQDILKDFRLRFDPAPPAHIDWTSRSEDRSERSLPEKGFLSRLRSLFSVESAWVRVEGNQYDLSATPYEVDFFNRSVVFLEQPVTRSTQSAHPIFSVDLNLKNREISVLELKVKNKDRANKVGLRPGVKITDLNGVPVSNLNRVEINEFLRGKNRKSLEIGFLRDPAKKEKAKVIFDFDSHEFIESTTLQSPARRQ